MNRIDYEELFCYTDDFCKAFEPWYNQQLLDSLEKSRKRKGKMSLSEVVTILLGFHRSGMSCFKYYYENLQRNHRSEFPQTVHYARFVKLIKKAFRVLLALLKSLLGKPTEYMFVDGTPLSVCHSKRRTNHRVFKGLARASKTSIGWFFGFKLHIILNTKGEIVRLRITPGNGSERKALLDMSHGLEGKLFGDKGYISKKLFETLFNQKIILFTKLKKGMKQRLLSLQDKVMLMKRSFIETVFSSIKSLGTFEHHRHRSPLNALCHWISGLISYQLRDDKPSLEKVLNFLP